ncbi:MAG TPA: Hsp20 family protein, partial [Thermodesulfobacteriota bacterium]|nr:Hsp20 family protein [Thermodesulfobacteriota bacterium]
FFNDQFYFKKQQEMNALFSRFFEQEPSCFISWGTSRFPSTTIREEHDAFVVRMDLAGYKAEDLSIVLEGAVLVIKAAPQPEPGPSRTQPPFTRIIRFQKTVDSDHVDAAFKDGILVIRLPIVPRQAAFRVAIP